MMLHEAVMLEIYRQALNASELVSPRCQSRESIASNGAAVAAENRCPSNDSVYSAHEPATAAGASTPTKAVTPAPAPSSSSPHMEMPLAATLPPAAAAALLQPQSAAMAAYLNAANHLFMNNSLATSLVHGAPNAAARRLISPDTTEDTALDFSAKPDLTRDSADEDELEEEVGGRTSEGSSDQAADSSTPLDLSCASRKRPSSEKTTEAEDAPSSPNRKVPKINEFKSWVTPSLNPYLAAVAAASLSPKLTNAYGNEWKKPATNEASKALERMTEMTKLGANAEKAEVPHKQQATSHSTNSQTNGNGRHSAWQSHWLNKGAHSVKDVFKCVWCKQSFPTLASLTTHMKETKHCGVNVPPIGNSSHLNQSITTATVPPHVGATPNMLNNNNNHNNNNTNKKSDLNLLIKETMPLPRKLVRGQDVWLGKGAEQTRQILKCMWCGQSFRSLAEMTSHMQETQHYTNIISQEQIISWKSTDEKTSSNSSGGAVSPASPSTTGTISNGSSASNTVSAVLTCKVCDQAFPSLKELSNHMVKNAHYKDPIVRDNSESPGLSSIGGRGRGGRQTREKRKKSLPVRKLLEIERAGQDQYGKSNSMLDPALKPLRDFAASTKITCEKCGDKIETALFVDHIRQCLGGTLLATPRNAQQSSRYSPQTPSESANRKSTDDRHLSPISANTQSDILNTATKDTDDKSNSLPSVLNALEQLIEKSFDIRPARQSSGIYGTGSASNTPLGASILKRLGIDDNVDYTKPLMDPNSMRYRSNSTYSGRDRSASESSSISERCSSLLEAPTPERNYDISRQTTPRLLTPEKVNVTPKDTGETDVAEYDGGQMKIKTEPNDEPVERESPKERADLQTLKISVKKEFNEFPNADGDANKPGSGVEEDVSKRTPTPHSSSSPGVSERSITPKSNHSNKKMMSNSGSSLTALSFMFDSLNNMTTSAPFTGGDANNNNKNSTNNNNSGKTGSSVGKKSNANPLAALQKLCETTTDPPAANTRSNNATTINSTSTGGVTATGGSGGSSMMTYGWDAVDDMIKCAYCDTNFYTKGAYRHHLLKVHFIKDDSGSHGGKEKSPKSNYNSPRSTSKSPATSTITSASARQELSPPSMLVPNTMPTINPYEESPQSKFRKYTELAKQLSSKNT